MKTKKQIDVKFNLLYKEGEQLVKENKELYQSWWKATGDNASELLSRMDDNRNRIREITAKLDALNWVNFISDFNL